MRNRWIWILIVALLLLAGLFLGGYLGPSPGPSSEGQQPSPHAIDQTP